MIYQVRIIIIIIPVMTFLVYPHDDGVLLMGIMNGKFMGGIKKGIYQTKDGSYGTLTIESSDDGSYGTDVFSISAETTF